VSRGLGTRARVEQTAERETAALFREPFAEWIGAPAAATAALLCMRCSREQQQNEQRERDSAAAPHNGRSRAQPIPFTYLPCRRTITSLTGTVCREVAEPA
jgi:hypothetical protein